MHYFFIVARRLQPAEKIFRVALRDLLSVRLFVGDRFFNRDGRVNDREVLVGGLRIAYKLTTLSTVPRI